MSLKSINEDLMKSHSEEIEDDNEPSIEKETRKSAEVLLISGETCDLKRMFQIYDIENDHWYPEKIVEGKNPYLVRPFAVCKGKVFVCHFPGHEDDDAGQVFIYDPVTEDRQDLNFQIKHMRFQSSNYPLDKQVYLVSLDTERNEVYSVDISKNAVTQCATLDERHEFAALAMLNGIIYVVGTESDDFNQTDCESYNPKTKEVKPIAKLPRSVYERSLNCNFEFFAWMTVTTYNGKLYAIDDCNLRYLYVYTPEEDTWEIKEVKYPPPVQHGRLITCNGKLICIDQRCFVNIYDAERNEWEHRADYNGNLYYVHHTFVYDKCYLSSSRPS